MHPVPAVLGVVGSLRATLIYLRHNLPQAAIGELLGVSQPTVSRAVKALTELVTRALDGYLVTAEEVVPNCDLCPGRNSSAPLELEGPPRAVVGQALAHLDECPDLLVTPAGRLVWVSDPCPGSTHDVAVLDASGLLEDLDPVGWVADKGYIGRGMIAPPRNPAGRKPANVARQVSRGINRIRYIVEQVNAHIKT